MNSAQEREENSRKLGVEVEFRRCDNLCFEINRIDYKKREII